MEEGLVEAIQNYGKNKIVVEKDIGVVSTKICRSCCLHDGMHAETLKIRLLYIMLLFPH